MSSEFQIQGHIHTANHHLGQKLSPWEMKLYHSPSRVQAGKGSETAWHSIDMDCAAKEGFGRTCIIPSREIRKQTAKCLCQTPTSLGWGRVEEKRLENPEYESASFTFVTDISLLLLLLLLWRSPSLQVPSL